MMLKTGSFFNYILNLNRLWSGLELQLKKETGLSSSELRGILSIEADREISCNEFSEQIGLSVSRSSRVIEKMVQDRLLRRDCDSNDRRRCVVCLSSRGAQMKKKVIGKIHLLEDTLNQHLSLEEIQSMMTGLDLMVSRLNNYLMGGN